ncbi:MAG: type II toxin-antitoxin system VapC family toxin [Chloroflexota bacterium]|nr:type II toxin-antitoxin system VapC family toxin [Chloroflexota bacterium]
MRFVDTNVFIRYMTRDDEEKARACYELFERVERGDEELFTTESIVAEITYVLSSRRGSYRLDHSAIRDRLLPLLSLRGLRMPQKGVCLAALDLYGSSPFLDFEDALAVAHMEQQGLSEILSYDRDFDRVARIERTEP